jgi:hypothetical protein
MDHRRPYMWSAGSVALHSSSGPNILVHQHICTANLEHFPDGFINKFVIIALFGPIETESWHSHIFTATINTSMSTTDQAKQQVYDYCKAMLGDGMIDIELDPIHYETALNRVWQFSANAAIMLWKKVIAFLNSY